MLIGHLGKVDAVGEASIYITYYHVLLEPFKVLESLLGTVRPVYQREDAVHVVNKAVVARDDLTVLPGHWEQKLLQTLSHQELKTDLGAHKYQLNQGLELKILPICQRLVLSSTA